MPPGPSLAIAVRLPARPRRWQVAVVERLRGRGHAVGVVPGPGRPRSWLDAVLAFEALRQPPGLSARLDEVPAAPLDRPADLEIDLTGAASAPGSLTLDFGGSPDPARAAATILAGGLPDLAVLRDGVPLATARPMVDERLWLSRGLDDVLARAIDLVDIAVRQLATGVTGEAPVAGAPPPHPAAGPLPAYAQRFAAGIARRAWHRALYRPFHWRVGYRFRPQGYAAPGPWQELPDDGSRFYADPFPVVWQGRHFLFVEGFEHARPRGFIAVAEADAAGRFGAPAPVLTEPFHLSYPQVFAHGGDMWMIPETMGARQLILYRAEDFPHRWVRHAVLLEDCALSDATLIEHKGRFWLLAAERGEAGSPSDRLSVFHAENLVGPWLPHPQNPILIDRARARPGGAAFRTDGRLFLPVQDGTNGYGGGLGLVEIVALDPERVEIGPLLPFPLADWPYPRRHTYNRAGALEVVDAAVDQRR